MLDIKFTKLAVEDLNNGYDYIYSENRSAAKEVIARIRSTLELLAAQPFIGHPGRVEGTYEFYVLNTPFIVVYILEKDDLIVVSFLHTSRQYP